MAVEIPAIKPEFRKYFYNESITSLHLKSDGVQA
jgi:hypothetical protein